MVGTKSQPKMFCNKSPKPNSQSAPGSDNFNCMLCLSAFTEDENFSRSIEVVEILSDIFKVLCIYLKWAPPSKFQYNFSNDLFPFCKECRLLLTKLYKYDKLLLEIQQQIDFLALKLSAKILESRNGQGALQQTDSSEISSYQNLTDAPSASNKRGYYRNSVCSRYSPTVKLISDPTLLRTENEIGATKEDDACQSDNPFRDNNEDEDINRNYDDGHEDESHIEGPDVSETENELDGANDDLNHSVSKDCQSSYISEDNDNVAEDKVMITDNDRQDHEFDSPNIEPFPSLGNRLTKVGDKFLLDKKYLFECSETRFKCFSCNIQYKTKDGLKSHLEECPGNPSEDVIETFSFRGRVYDKIKSGELRCRRCKYLCQSKKPMVLHIREFHSKRQTKKNRIKPLYSEVEPNKFLCNHKYPFEFKDDKFHCGSCLLDFSTRSEILSHIHREHMWLGMKKCAIFKTVSPGKFAWTDPFNKIYSFEKVGSSYKCNECSHSRSSLKYMKSHVRCIHINKGSSTCKICGKVCNSIYKLKWHLNTHKDDRPFMCEFCGKSYNVNGALTSHKAEKHPEIFDKKYKCEVCGRVLGSLTHLRAHEKSHKYCVCHVCGKNTNMLHFNHHLETHEPGEGKYECKKCSKKFKHPGGLHAHLKSHDGAKPYSCDICGMKFTQSYSVTRHKNVAHNPNKITNSSVKSRKRKWQADVSREEKGSEESSEESNSEDENSEIMSNTNEKEDM